ncbi:MAG: hypothetical protein K6G81_07140 [Lachnospiraceae bacterium]|nr:hypothetical protein [Lachnospiraceae bacterium]
MDNLLSEEYYKELTEEASLKDSPVDPVNEIVPGMPGYELVKEGIERESRRVIFSMLDNGCPPEKISYLCGYSREYVEKMIRLWDSDFTKISPAERKTLGTIEEKMRNGEYITADQIFLQLKK